MKDAALRLATTCSYTPFLPHDLLCTAGRPARLGLRTALPQRPRAAGE
jgi:hypothetical protein